MSKAKFFQKMKKKPAQQEVLDNIEKYSDEDIDNLTGPHFPQWIKDELKELNKRGGTTAEAEAERICTTHFISAQCPNRYGSESEGSRHQASNAKCPASRLVRTCSLKETSRIGAGTLSLAPNCFACPNSIFQTVWTERKITF
jgi:hypothetical protein